MFNIKRLFCSVLSIKDILRALSVNRFQRYSIAIALMACIQPLLCMQAPQAEAVKEQEQNNDALQFDSCVLSYYLRDINVSREFALASNPKPANATRNLKVASNGTRILELRIDTYRIHELRETVVKNIEKILHSNDKPRDIGALSDTELADVIELLDVFGMYELLDLTLTFATYAKKLIPAKPATEEGCPRLTRVADFSSDQYASLEVVAKFILDKDRRCKAIVKEPCSLTPQRGKVKLALLRWFLHSDACTLTPSKRLKLGWLMALEEEDDDVRDRIFEEIAYFLAKCHGDDGLSERSYLLSDKLTQPQQLYTKASIRSVCTLLHELKKTPDKVFKKPYEPFATKEELICTPFSSEFQINLIQDVREEAQQKRTTRAKIDFLRSVLCAHSEFGPDSQKVVPQKRGFYFEHILEACIFLNIPIFETPQVNDAQRLTATEELKTIFLQRVELYPTKLCMEDRFGICTRLLCGADINAQNENGNTLAHLVLINLDGVMLNFFATISKLGLSIDMNVENNKGVTPLQLLHAIKPDQFSDEEGFQILSALAPAVPMIAAASSSSSHTTEKNNDKQAPEQKKLNESPDSTDNEPDDSNEDKSDDTTK